METTKHNITTPPQIEGSTEVEVNNELCVSHDPIEGTAGHSSSHSVLSEEGIMVLSGKKTEVYRFLKKGNFQVPVLS